MNIAICDDDKTVVEEVENLVNEFMSERDLKYEVYSFTSGKDLLDSNVRFDVIYLDVEMPGLNGLEVSKQIFERHPRTFILIITSYNHYLDDAFELKVYRYIFKPFNKADFFKNLKKACQDYSKQSRPIQIKSNDEITKINSCDIIYLAIEDEKVFVYTCDEVIRTTENFSYWRKKLDGLSFFQVHQSFIINLDYLKKVSKGKALLIYRSRQYIIPVSTRKFVSLKKAWHNYIGGLR